MRKSELHTGQRLDPLMDSHGRRINYMRLAVTDRCNLRCFYCMPEQGIDFLPKKDILSYEEMMRLIQITHRMGVDKIRITGGEPLVRKGLIEFAKSVRDNIDLRSFSITSNATLTHLYEAEIIELFDSINISLDSLDRARFQQITRRDEFELVFQNINSLIDSGMDVKINAVVMDGKNNEDILPFVEWTRNNKVDVRFIEEMPFNGSRSQSEVSNWNHVKILDHIQSEFKNVIPLANPKSSTSVMYQVKDFAGRFGIIPAFSRTFCGSCNRIRMTAKGELRSCSYSAKGTPLLPLLRSTNDDAVVAAEIRRAIIHKEKDGFEAAAARNNSSDIYESMTSIGG